MTKPDAIPIDAENTEEAPLDPALLRLRSRLMKLMFWSMLFTMLFLLLVVGLIFYKTKYKPAVKNMHNIAAFDNFIDITPFKKTLNYKQKWIAKTVFYDNNLLFFELEPTVFKGAGIFVIPQNKQIIGAGLKLSETSNSDGIIFKFKLTIPLDEQFSRGTYVLIFDKKKKYLSSIIKYDDSQ